MPVRLNKHGYTIVEVMVFLVISGAMFLIAATFVQGKQSTTEFRQGINELNTQIQQVINDVSNGLYPPNNKFNCRDQGAGFPPRLSGGANPNGFGGNVGCIYIGKVMQFGSDGTSQRGYRIFSIAGRQYKVDQSDGVLATTFAYIKPIAVCGASASTCPDPNIDITESRQIQWGLRVTRLKNGSVDIEGMGFFTHPGSYRESNLNPGSRAVMVVVIPGNNMDASVATMADHINAQINDANIKNNPDILMCLTNDNGQFGTLRLGGAAGQRLTTSISISNTIMAECT